MKILEAQAIHAKAQKLNHPKLMMNQKQNQKYPASVEIRTGGNSGVPQNVSKASGGMSARSAIWLRPSPSIVETSRSKRESWKVFPAI